jgi:hypothetical protein
MRGSRIRQAVLIGVMAVAGCNSNKPFIALGPRPATVEAPPTTQPVATSELGTVSHVPGVAPKPKPFIAVPKPIQMAGAKPSTLLLEHASPDSPVPLSDYAKQPVYDVSDFHLSEKLSANQLKREMGQPAQLADLEDPWFVYRITGNRELWLHFSGLSHERLDAADLIRGAEDGYVRTRLFSTADDVK